MSGLNDTPRANRTHIAFFGKTNAGKSTAVNALCNQELALTSPVAGTTTDPVYKSMELLPLGAVVIIDTAGIGDASRLGEKRMEKTREVVDKTDIAVMVIASDSEDISEEKSYIDIFRAKNTPVIAAINVFGENKGNIAKSLGIPFVYINALKKEGMDVLKALITQYAATDEPSLLGDLVSENDVAVLVMPQDIQAPKGRLILPQVQLLRELLDRNCRVFCVKTDDVARLSCDLKEKPALVITDSQIFKKVCDELPEDVRLTSFSVLMSRSKGDIDEFVRGAHAIAALKPGDRVLILEACTHHAMKGDIAREKLPKMLEKYVGGALDVEVVSGHGFPKDTAGVKLAVTCGGCMINRKNMLSRIDNCRKAGIPITNFGVAIAFVNGILDKIVY